MPQIVLDRKSFQALAVDTRVKLLKSLSERRRTLTELSQQLEMSPSSIKEHLDVLKDVSLVQMIDDGHKWKYYEITRKGSEIIQPRETKVLIILGLSLLGVFAFGLSLYNKLFSSISYTTSASDAYRAAESSGIPQGIAQEAAKAVASGVGTTGAAGNIGATANAAENITANLTANLTSCLPPAPAQGILALPYIEIAGFAMLILLTGLCLGYLLRRSA